MNILIAPNAFKNSLNADKAADAINIGLQQSKLVCTTKVFPVGDGGDGTAQLLIQHLNGKIINGIVHDPLGRKITASFGLIDNDKTAVIELADASGLKLLQVQEYDPLSTSTYGTGELIKAALDMNVKKIILCIGGSATVDGGTGILQALGMKFMDDQDNELINVSSSVTGLKDINATGLDKRLLKTECIILCDVENYLLGPEGAANVFGPQKGASKEKVQQLETFLSQLQDVILKNTGKDIATIKQGGAAGGVSAGLHVFLNAKLVKGIDYFLDMTNFDLALQKADLVITGEGSIDMQTLHGKGPYGVAKRAKEKSIRVIGMAGQIPSKANKELEKYFDVLLSINNHMADINSSMRDTYDNLVRTAKLLGDSLSISIQ